MPVRLTLEQAAAEIIFRLIKPLLSKDFTKEQGKWIQLETGLIQRKEKKRGKGEEGLTAWALRQGQVEAPPLEPRKSQDYLEWGDDRRLA